MSLSEQREADRGDVYETFYSEFNVEKELPKYQSARKKMLKVPPHIEGNTCLLRDRYGKIF